MGPGYPAVDNKWGLQQAFIGLQRLARKKVRAGRGAFQRFAAPLTGARPGPKVLGTEQRPPEALEIFRALRGPQMRRGKPGSKGTESTPARAKKLGER